MKNLYLVLLFLCGNCLAAQLAPFSRANTIPPNASGILAGVKSTHLQIERPEVTAAMLAATSQHDDRVVRELNLTLPGPDGTSRTFRIYRYQMINPALQAKYPSFVTLYGWDADYPARRIQLDWTAKGFGATVVGGPEGRWMIAPSVQRNQQHYQVYFTRDFPRRTDGSDVCDFTIEDELLEDIITQAKSVSQVGDCQLREYDLALACTAEYFNQIAGITPTATPTGQDTSAVVSEMIVAINRVNQVFRADLALQMNIINLPAENENVQLIYAGNPGQDPYTNDDGAAMLDENQLNVDDVIGPGNYDIGHVFSTGGGGIASLDSPCKSGFKARGVTGLPNPVGDPFYIDFVAHEMGHQFGGTHTFNSTEVNCAERFAGTAYEPGSGTTIQAYAGICGPTANIQLNSDPYYHAASIQQMAAYMELGGGSTCADVASMANSEPVTDAGTDYTIPANTPFVLTASATDGDGDALTYSWEQFDLGPVVAGPPTGNETESPLFRSRPPTPSPERYFPDLTSLTSGAANEWEVLPLVARDLNFIVTVRDLGAAGYGCLTQDEMTVTVEASPGFAVSAPNGGEAILGGSTSNVTWDVAGTGPGTAVDCDMVDVMLSTDGGLTYPDLLGTVPNTGSASLMFPAVTETDARVMIRCSGNIFFDISDADFRIEQTDFALSAGTTIAAACSGADQAGTYSFTLESLQGYVGTVDYEAAGLPNGTTITFTPAQVTLGDGDMTEVTFVIDGLSGLPPEEVLFQVMASDGNMVNDKSEDFVFEVKPDLETPTLLSPADNGFVDPTASAFSWTAVPNATSYLIQIYTNTTGTGGFLSSTVTSSGVNFGDNLSGSFNEGDMGSWRVTAIDEGCDPDAESVSDLFTFTYGAPSGAALSVTNNMQTICEGDELDDFEVGFSNGDLTGPVTLSVTDAPGGITAAFVVSSVDDGEFTDLVVTGEENLSAGSYEIDIQADDGTNTEAFTLSFTVQADEIPFNFPADGEQLLISADGTGTIRFSFDAVAGANSYTLSISASNAGTSTAPLGGAGTFNLPVGDVSDGDQFTLTLSSDNGLSSCPITVTFVDEILPVEWLTFTATPARKSVRLDWSVLQDDAHAGFTVQRSETLTGWQEMAEMPHQPLIGEATYSYDDPAVMPGVTYHYRLRQRDADGTFAFSSIRSVTFANAPSLRLFPNPVTNQLTVEVGADAGAVQGLKYQVVNALGQITLEGQLETSRVTLDVSGLPRAVYQFIVSDGAKYREVKRVVKR